jgi:hypothetical protein
VGSGKKKPFTLLKPKQIMIAVAILHPLLIQQLDNYIQLPIQGLNLTLGIDIIAN